MATFKTISSADITTSTSVLNQLVDLVAEDVSGSTTRKKYQVFVTGTVGDLGVTSSLFQTVFDQDHTLQTANEMFDLSVGLFSGSATVSDPYTATDINGKLLFTSQSLMMREKVSVYRQFAQLLLGNAGSQFAAPYGSSTTSDLIDEALFISFKRLFVRDGIKRETFAMRFYQSASSATQDEDGALSATGQSNLYRATTSGSIVFTDVGSASSIEVSPTGGEVGNIVNSSNTSETVGLLFYQQGIAILDLAKVTSGSQRMSGSISSVGNSNGSTLMSSATNSRFIPDFLVSGSIDDIVDHMATVRFGNGAVTFGTFQNNTRINSTLVFCRANPGEFNYSSNPTYVDNQGRIRVVDASQVGIQKAFSFITTIGLYDAYQNLLAVAKLSRPVEKNDQKDLTFRVRLDF